MADDNSSKQQQWWNARLGGGLQGERRRAGNNNNGIRQKADKPGPPGREREKNKEVKSMQKVFFQQYGLCGWIFCSRQNTQCLLLDLSVLNM
jgi:hypothetical protein